MYGTEGRGLWLLDALDSDAVDGFIASLACGGYWRQSKIPATNRWSWRVRGAELSG
jgi:hypothetical protein